MHSTAREDTMLTYQDFNEVNDNISVLTGDSRSRGSDGIFQRLFTWKNTRKNYFEAH